MKNSFIVLFFFFVTLDSTIAQQIIDWSPDYELTFEDFLSKKTKIGYGDTYQINSTAGMGFSFQMTNYEWMFTKNFNSKVTNTFNKNAAVLVAPNLEIANSLLAFANYQFDLVELYARKFRQKLYENKGAFSNPTFFQPIYNEIQSELNERHSEAGEVSNLGIKSEVLKEIHQEVLAEIAELGDFCKDCKPPKAKKNNEEKE
jgi:hypothetical protein